MKIETKKINALTVGLSCLAIMIFNINVNPLQEAWALQFANTNVTSGYSVVGLKYIPFGTHNYAVDIETKASPVNFIARVVDTNNTNTVSTLNLNSSLPRPTIGTTFSFENISCDVTGTGLCALAFFSSTTVTRVVVFDAIHNLASPVSGGGNWTSGQNTAVAFSHGSGTSTIFMGYLDSGGTNHFKIVFWSINNTASVNNPLQAVSTFDTLQNGFTPTNGVLGSVPFGSATSGNYVAWMSSAGTLALYRSSTNTFSCIVSLGAGGAGDIDFVNLGTSGNYWLASAKTTNNIKQVDFGCNILTTITASANVNGISHSPSRNEFYYQSGSAVFVGNLTSLSSTTITSFSVGANNGQAYGDMITNDQATASGTTGLFVGSGLSTSKITWIYWGAVGSGGGTGGSGSGGCPSSTPNCGDIVCSLPQNTGILMCVPQAPLVGASQTVGQGVNNLLVGSGLINSTNTNIKTNGVGYIIVAVALGVLISMFWLASGGDLNKIPTFVWFIATLSILGLSVSAGFIDVTFFIIGAIAIIALASAKIISTLDLGRF